MLHRHFILVDHIGVQVDRPLGAFIRLAIACLAAHHEFAGWNGDKGRQILRLRRLEGPEGRLDDRLAPARGRLGRRRRLGGLLSRPLRLFGLLLGFGQFALLFLRLPGEGRQPLFFRLVSRFFLSLQRGHPLRLPLRFVLGQPLLLRFTLLVGRAPLLGQPPFVVGLLFLRLGQALQLALLSGFHFSLKALSFLLLPLQLSLALARLLFLLLLQLGQAGFLRLVLFLLARKLGLALTFLLFGQPLLLGDFLFFGLAAGFLGFARFFFLPLQFGQASGVLFRLLLLAKLFHFYSFLRKACFFRFFSFFQFGRQPRFLRLALLLRLLAGEFGLSGARFQFLFLGNKPLRLGLALRFELLFGQIGILGLLLALFLLLLEFPGRGLPLFFKLFDSLVLSLEASLPLLRLPPGLFLRLLDRGSQGFPFVFRVPLRFFLCLLNPVEHGLLSLGDLLLLLLQVFFRFLDLFLQRAQFALGGGGQLAPFPLDPGHIAGALPEFPLQSEDELPALIACGHHRGAAGQLVLDLVRHPDRERFRNILGQQVGVCVLPENLHEIPGKRAMALLGLIGDVRHRIEPAGCQNPSRGRLVQLLDRPPAELSRPPHQRSAEAGIHNRVDVAGGNVSQIVPDLGIEDVG